jgi:hypothetical protein
MLDMSFHPTPPPPPPPSQAPAPPVQPMAAAMGLGNSSSYTLTNGRTNSMSTVGNGRVNSITASGALGNGNGLGNGGSGMLKIHDLRWKFQDDNTLPAPRQWKGVGKKYRAGRISSVPLDLRGYE